MKVTGEQLYAIYFDSMSDKGIQCDPWVSLDVEETEAWDELAAKINEL